MRLFDTENTQIRKSAYIICMIMCIGIYFSITYHALSFAVLGIALICVFVFNTQEIFCELMFLLPFAMIFKFSPTSTSLFTYLALVAVIRLVISGKGISGNLFVIIVLFGVSLVFGAKQLINTNKTTEIVKITSNMLLLACFTNTIKRKNFSHITMFLSLGLLTSSLIGLQKQGWSNLSAFFRSSKSEYVGEVVIKRFTGLYPDPNYFGIMIIICIMMLAVLIYTKEIKFKIGIPMIAGLVIFGVMSYSRIFYISLAIGAAFIFFATARGKNIIGITIVFAAGIALFIFLMQKYGMAELVVERFGREDASNANGRFDLWARYIEAMREDLSIFVFGAGIGSKVLKEGGAHNTFLEHLYFMGLIRTIVYYIIHYNIMKKRAMPYFKRKPVNFSMLIVVCIMFSTLGMLFKFDFSYVLMFCWMFMNTDISAGYRALNERKV